MPGALHEQLAQAAERDHVSLNRFVTETLATSVSRSPSPRPADGGGPADTTPGATVPAAVRTPPPARTIRMVLAANLVVVVLAAAVAVVLLVLALERGI